jgi:hypothetical protein
MGEALGVGDGGDVGVEGGTGVAVGTTGVDSPGFGEGLSAGISVATGLEPDGAVAVSPDGVQVSVAPTLASLPCVRATTEAQAPKPMNSSTTKNAAAEPLPCMKTLWPSRLISRSNLADDGDRAYDTLPDTRKQADRMLWKDDIRTRARGSRSVPRGRVTGRPMAGRSGGSPRSLHTILVRWLPSPALGGIMWLMEGE